MKSQSSEAKISNVVSLCSARTKLQASPLAKDEYLTITKTNPHHIQIVYNFVAWVSHEIRGGRDNANTEKRHLLASIANALPFHSYAVITRELEILQRNWIGELPEPAIHMIVLMKLIAPAIDAMSKGAQTSLVL